MARSVWNGDDVRATIEIEVTEKLLTFMKDYLPEKVSRVFITDSDVRHIKKQHGKSEEIRGQKSIRPSDFACIPIVLNEFEACEHTDTDKLGNKKFLFRKEIESVVYLVTVQQGKSKLEIKTMWRESIGCLVLALRLPWANVLNDPVDALILTAGFWHFQIESLQFLHHEPFGVIDAVAHDLEVETLIQADCEFCG